mgnify:CR=1 FL=1
MDRSYILGYMMFLQKNLWPIFVFLYPLVVLPWTLMPGRPGVVLAKMLLTGLFLFLGILIEMQAHPHAHLRDLLHLPKHLRKDLPTALLLALALVMGLSSAFSPEPIVALTGSLSDFSDGLFFSLAMVGIALLVYLRAQKDSDLPRRLALGVLLGGAVLVALSIGEVVLGRSVFYPTAPQWALPVVTFPSKGHLAGYFTLMAGVALGLRSSFGLYLSAVGVGLTFNRAALLALAVLALLAFWRAPRHSLRVVFMLVLGLLSGMGMIRLAPAGAERSLTDPGTFFTRLYYWKAALGGIAARPLLGWGGGVFDIYWPNFLTIEQLEHFIQSEWGYKDNELVGINSQSGTLPTFLLKKAKPDKSRGKDFLLLRVIGFRAHNGFLEVALKWGLVGLGLYFILLLTNITPRLLEMEPLALGLLSIHVFFLFWFAIPEEEGVIWVLMGAGLSLCARRRN